MRQTAAKKSLKKRRCYWCCRCSPYGKTTETDPQARDIEVDVPVSEDSEGINDDGAMGVAEMGSGMYDYDAVDEAMDGLDVRTRGTI